MSSLKAANIFISQLIKIKVVNIAGFLICIISLVYVLLDQVLENLSYFRLYFIKYRSVIDTKTKVFRFWFKTFKKNTHSLC